MTAHQLPGEPPAVAALRARSDEVRALVGAATGGGDLRHVVGVHELVVELRRLQPTARRECWVMQPQYFYDPEDPGIELVREARRERGVETTLVTRPATVRTHPLLASIFPTTLLGPVFLRAMVIDRAEMLIEGLDTADGERTSWLTDRPELVRPVVELWLATLEECRPILPPGQTPPLTERQLEVARLVAVGEKDSSIARQLHLSGRTVEREVGVLLHHLGARSRTEAVLMMRGRGVNGGRPQGF